MAEVYLAIKIALGALMLIAAGFIIFVVMKQSGNSDGMEAFAGSSSKSDGPESFYGKNSSAQKEARLKIWTYVCAGVFMVCALAFLILGAIVG